MIIGIPKEVAPGERRVALVPDSVGKLTNAGYEIRVERGAGVASACSDADYEQAGASARAADEVYGESDIVVRVRPPEIAEVERLKEGSTLISVLHPFFEGDLVRTLAKRGITSLALDLMPRTTLAQSMDVLSSMSTLAGYKSALIAAEALPKIFPMMMTAAGTIRPTRVLIVGAGVAGLQAIATARRLGAVVEAFDIRAAAKEQVESLGARFVEDEQPSEDAETATGYAREQTAEERERSQQLLASRCIEADVVITTALVPGRQAPVLLTNAMVDAMRPGSLVVDLAAEQGGNCEPSVAGQVIDRGGVAIHGPVDVASSLSVHASQMFSRNVMNYLLHVSEEGKLALDREDELVTGPMVTRGGEIVHARVREALEGS